MTTIHTRQLQQYTQDIQSTCKKYNMYKRLFREIIAIYSENRRNM